ncbi:MAG: type II toxin-antitoxin system VapC family toxin [Cyanobium sp. CZS 25K]|nr:type II toxin-antitoxin system VapC family toxin [Cyanobium sp. CZS25K]
MARLLLDTHLVLWWLSADPRLSTSVVSLLQETGQEVFVSQASLWEMAIKRSLGRLSADLAQVERSIAEQGFRWLSLRNEHLLSVGTLEFVEGHRDPFDRLLVAQSRCEPLLLLSADRQLAAYGATVRLV